MALEFIPCAQNKNPGEQVTRNFIMSKMEYTSGVMLGNYHIPYYNSTLECDLVLLNQWGIWVIEVKNWRGPIVIDQVDWKRSDGFVVHSPLKSVEYKAKNLASIVTHAGFKNISVIGLAVLVPASAVLINSDGDEVIFREPQENKVFHLDERLIRSLNGRNMLYEEANKTLTLKEIRRIVSMLLPRKVDPQHEYIGDSYRILYDLGTGPNEVFHAYQAVHTSIPDRFARAKKYSMPSAHSTGTLRDSTQHFRRDMMALEQMKQHPNIVKVYDYQADRSSDDIFWLLLEWINGVTLQYRLEVGPEIPFSEQASILKAMLSALESCHANGILHRHLTPMCIYLARDGTVKLGDFDYARVPALSMTITITGQPLPVESNRYMAPELRTDAFSADARSDLYALGAIWYDMIFRPEPGERLDLTRLEEADIPIEARDLLTHLLCADPQGRPQSAKAAKRWLELVQDSQ